MDESDKALMTRAWWYGALSKMDPKKFPKRPSLMWDKESDRQSAVTMANIALMWADNGEEFRKKLNNKMRMN